MARTKQRFHHVAVPPREARDRGTVPRRRTAPRSLLLAVAAVLLFPLSFPPSRAGAQPRPPTSETSIGTERMVDVAGHAVRVHVVGLEARDPDEPVLVFENGAGTSLESWRSILPEVAGLAPAVTYDRPGLGGSEWDRVPPRPRHVATRLGELLEVLGLDPPYVLVGHSWGGLLVREFAIRHGSEVAGMVLVDPTSPTRASDLRAALDEIGAGAAGYRAYRRMQLGPRTGVPPGVRAERRVIVEMAESRFGLEGDPEIEFPVAVLMAGRAPSLPPEVARELPFDPARLWSAFLPRRISSLSDFALRAPDGFFVVTNGSGHFVHRDEPSLVVRAIRRVLGSSRSE